MVKRESHGGFTTVELLVVIAIIAILAAILFPVFGAARERSRMVACSSNCRQIYLAFRMYTQDWERFPPRSEAGDDIFSAPQYLLPYTKEIRIFCCPGDTWSLWPDRRRFPGKPTCKTKYGEFAVLGEGLFKEVETSYLWNLALAGMAPEMDRSPDAPGQGRLACDPAEVFWAYDSFSNHLGGA
jgi:prepilin-type N-terminal cleavage/methylation domain-containing protein